MSALGAGTPNKKEPFIVIHWDQVVKFGLSTLIAVSLACGAAEFTRTFKKWSAEKAEIDRVVKVIPFTMLKACSASNSVDIGSETFSNVIVGYRMQLAGCLEYLEQQGVSLPDLEKLIQQRHYTGFTIKKLQGFIKEGNIPDMFRREFAANIIPAATFWNDLGPEDSGAVAR